MKRLLTLSLLCPLLMSAQGYQVHVQGQKQQAMGNAGNAFAQDGAAIFYNPGGISFVNNSVSVGGNGAIVNSAIQDSITNKVFESKVPVSTPVTLYAVYGADSSKSSVLKNLKFGVGVYTPFGGGVKYDDDFVGRYIVKSLDIKIISIQPTISYKIGNKVGIGAGFVYSMGSFAVSKDLYLADSTGNVGAVDIKSKLSSMGVNAGVYFKATDAFSVALSFRSGVKAMKSTGGTAEFKTPALLKDSVPNGAAVVELPLPTVVSFGLGYKVTDEFSLAFDANYIGFKVFDSLRIDFDKNTGNLKDIAEPRMWKNAYSFHIGGQYLFTPAFALRMGLRYVVSPVPDGRVSPEGGDANRLALCGGLGYKIGKHLAIDAAYSFENITREDHNVYNNFIGNYKTYANIIGLSVSYNF